MSRGRLFTALIGFPAYSSIRFSLFHVCLMLYVFMEANKVEVEGINNSSLNLPRRTYLYFQGFTEGVITLIVDTRRCQNCLCTPDKRGWITLPHISHFFWRINSIRNDTAFAVGVVKSISRVWIKKKYCYFKWGARLHLNGFFFFLIFLYTIFQALVLFSSYIMFYVLGLSLPRWMAHDKCIIIIIIILLLSFQNLKRRICKLQRKPLETLMKIQKSAKRFLATSPGGYCWAVRYNWDY